MKSVWCRSKGKQPARLEERQVEMEADNFRRKEKEKKRDYLRASNELSAFKLKNPDPEDGSPEYLERERLQEEELDREIDYLEVGKKRKDFELQKITLY